MESSPDPQLLQWERQPGEPLDWFLRFQEFALPLGSDYSISRAYTIYLLEASRRKQSDTVPYVTWISMGDQWHWHERVFAWAVEEKIIRTNLWRARRLQLAESDWGTGEQLRGFARDVLNRMKTHETGGKDADGNVLVRVTVRPSELAQMVKTSSDLQRLAAGEPTDLIGTAEPSIQFYLPAIEKEQNDNPTDQS